jgi:serine/threonine-protein kinase
MAEAGLSAGTLFGGYRIESFLARGGMGLVYKATQLALERTVALKLVAPELAHDQAFRERFKREALLAASLDHPNILPVYEAGEIDGQLFLAMRLVAGTDLDSVIRREQALAPERAAAIVMQVAAALDAAHSRGLVHRDVKPGNVLIAAEYGEERAYLTDFGLTKNVATNAHLTRTGHMVGTLDYVAPEQAQGGKVDGRADTYALACLLFVTVTGQVPFDRPTDAAKLWAHLNDSPPSAAAVSPAVSPELDAVIQRGMSKRPEERYASSGEFARAAHEATVPRGVGRLDRTEIDPAALDPAEVEAQPARQASRTGADGTGTGGRSRLDRAFGSRRRAAYAAGAALVLIVGAIVALAAGGSGGGKPSTTPAAATSAVSTAARPTTTTSAADAQLTAYHAQVAQITPLINSFRLPQGKDFGKPVFSRTVLASAATLRGTADSLDALSPPPQLLTDHEGLVAHLREMEQALRSLAVDSDNRNFSGARTDLDRLKAANYEVAAGVRAVQANGAG